MNARWGSSAEAEFGDDDSVTTQLRALTTPEFLAEIGWSDDFRVVIFPKYHPVLGGKECTVDQCTMLVHNKSIGLCAGCADRWRKTGQPDLEVFVAIARPPYRAAYALCAVPGCARPQQSKSHRICASHHYLRTKTLDVPLNDFLSRSDLEPLASHGWCAVAACIRVRHSSVSPYCPNHLLAWQSVRGDRQSDERSGDAAAVEERFRRTTTTIAVGCEISLRGLADRVVAELLFGLQQRTTSGVQTRTGQLRNLVDHIVRQQVTSVEQIELSALRQDVKIVCSNVVNEIRRSRITPESERHKDLWDVSVFGMTGTVRFDAISQPWLREAVKIWAYNDLPRRRGSTHAKDSIRMEIRSMGELSESLRLQRPGDRGMRPELLSRSDVAGFMNRMAFQHASGVLSSGSRITMLSCVRRVLSRMRSMGLTQPGEAMAGLPDDFVLHEEDIPTAPRFDPQGRDLPAEVMRHLCAHLHILDEMFIPEVRVAVELSMDTGRRPDEICQLGFDCLERDGSGKPVLIYDNIKSNRPGRRLPITESTAGIIVGQQQRVRKRYPTEPAGSLKLLPAKTRNPHGTRGVTDNWIARQHRMWVSTLPEIRLATTTDIASTQPATLRPFDMVKVILYAYRHTYCQRHADAGVGIDVLAELMDHRSTATTQGYYRVGEERRRDAVDRLTTMHFDRHGTKIWHEAKALLDSEHVRRAVGQVAVPYGTCSEPSNVAAGGGDCPIRFRCIGCAHFATDVSYLPDLEAYLADLLRSRERLRSALDADDWAKTEATPSEDEISRIRHLISRINTETDQLSPEERRDIEESIAVVRKARNRTVGLGTPRIRSSLPRIGRHDDA